MPLVHDPDPRKWLEGYCATFAIAFQSRFGGELWAIVNHSNECPDVEDDNLYHCYAVLDGIAYDGEGAHPLEEASDTSAWKIPDMDEGLDAVIQWRQVDEEYLTIVCDDGDLRDGVDEALEFIQQQGIGPKTST